MRDGEGVDPTLWAGSTNDTSHRRLAILTCMDARLDAAGFLDLWPEPVHLIRNAGGRASDDALRSLAVSCSVGVNEVLVVHHTSCAMAERSEADIRATLPPGAEAAEIDFLTIEDPLAALRADVTRIRASPLLPDDLHVVGMIYDLVV
jgi:carbonic anhydrase